MEDDKIIDYKNILTAFFIIISIIISITSINVNAQWLPYPGFNFYQNSYGYGWNQPYISSYNSYSLKFPYNYGWNMPYNYSAFLPPNGNYYGSNSSYGTYTSTFEDSFNPPYGAYSVAPGYAMPTSNNPNYRIWGQNILNLDYESPGYQAYKQYLIEDWYAQIEFGKMNKDEKDE